MAKDPPLDCFYVYPTVSRDQGLNSDMRPDKEETYAAETQFARFAGVCRTFAPIYEQMTIGAIAAYSAGADIKTAAAIAYRDVAAAWHNYLTTKNNGRPFVLIGHSQGSLMLQMLISREIEANPAVAARMKLAIMPGFNVLVPEGKLVGGTFKRTPLCSRAGQTGCIMSWVSFREKNVPPGGAIFGVADQPGMTVGCVNPALPGSLTGSPSTVTGSRSRAFPCPAAQSAGRRKGRRRRPTCGRKTSSPPSASPKANAGICRSAPTTIPATSAPTASGVKWACSACSCPAGACTLPTWQLAQGDLIREVGDIAATEARSIQNSCSTGTLSAAASFRASRVEGTNTPFSTVLIVFRETGPISASSTLRQPKVGAPFLQAIA